MTLPTILAQNARHQRGERSLNLHERHSVREFAHGVVRLRFGGQEFCLQSFSCQLRCLSFLCI